MNFRLLPLIASITLLTLLCIAATPDSPQRTESSASFFDQLEQASLKKITLSLNLNELIENKNTREYLPAQLAFAEDNWEVKVRARGRYRRRICDFPPLRLKFSKDMLEAAGLDRHNKFKLVTHCSDDFNNADNVAREQLAYELYSLVNGDGYRTELVQITYKDTETGEEIERLGIIIEDTDEMADHMAGTECDDCINLPVTDFAENSIAMNTMFQYMIGNTDYSVVKQRNVKLVQLKAGGKYIPVPYDFDFSGLVDTEYAIPNVDFQQASIKDRVWVWEYENQPNLGPVAERFLDKEEAIIQHIQNFETLSNRSRRQIENYLNDFFKSLKDGTFYTENNLPRNA